MLARYRAKPVLDPLFFVREERKQETEVGDSLTVAGLIVPVVLGVLQPDPTPKVVLKVES